MFTVCPKCALTLVVTTADLRVAQGYVRCGRCLNVFNALARLSEERPPPAPEQAPETETGAVGPEQQTVPVSPPPPVPAPPAAPVFAPLPTPDDSGEIEFELDASILVTAVRPPVAAKPAIEAAAEPQVRPAAPMPAPALPPVSEPLPASETVALAEPQAGKAPAKPVAPLPFAAVSASTPISPPEKAAPPPPAVAPAAQQTNTAEQPADGAFGLDALRRPVGLAWKLGAGALAIVLALQVVNHYRDALAADSALRGPLTAIYSTLGVKLAPRWNIHAYDVRQLGASVAGAAAGQIVVRASVKNGASRAQPLPLLRVTLQDRFGNRIAARDVPPNDYLPSSVAPSTLLAAGSRVDATMVFVDPGPQAVGFEIDACLRQESGEVACAHGPQ